MEKWGITEDLVLTSMIDSNENPMSISRATGRSLCGVYTRASRLGITRQYIDWGVENTKYIIRKHLQGESYKEIGESLGISATSVKQRFYVIRNNGKYDKYLEEMIGL